MPFPTVAEAAMLEAELDRILTYVDRYSRAQGFPPSYAEIAEACGLGSVGHVQYRVNRLIGQGRLSRSPGRARSLIVTAPKVDKSATAAKEHNGIKRRAAALIEVVSALIRR